MTKPFDPFGRASSPEVVAPLALFAGAEPPQTPWFKAAVAIKPERSTVSVGGAAIELLTWGNRGKPGLLFVHGNSAHADWWSFIAPLFADDYRVAALSLSGMGGSDWRDAYSFETYAQELRACAEAAGLYDAPDLPTFIGHSFGGAVVFYAAAVFPQWMRAGILIDTGFGGPPTAEDIARYEKANGVVEGAAGRWRDPFARDRPNRVYPTLQAALARFRFMPPQVPGDLGITDFIARHALKRAPLPDAVSGDPDGWTWRFDPMMMKKFNHADLFALHGRDVKRVAHIIGDRSALTDPDIFARAHADLMPADAPKIVIPDCAHHVMVDQPLALVAALRTLLAVWPA